MIPVQYYTFIYYQIILLIVLLTWGFSNSTNGFSYTVRSFSRNMSIFLLLFLLLYMGLRPISGRYFGDMGTYARLFRNYSNYDYSHSGEDIAFYTLMKWLSYFGNVRLFFLTLTLLYILPLYYASKRWFPRYYYFSFLILVTSFSFWSFGTNGLRNGIATSLMILAFSYFENKKIMYILFLLSYGFHSTMLLIIILYFLSQLIKKMSFYYWIWLLSIPLSLVMGSFWENLFVQLGFGGKKRLEEYFINKEVYKDLFSSTGFRWDFLIYSSIPIALSWYFIKIKKFNDKYYRLIVKLYLLANAFWILVIRANFSSRFAYLSWFMMGIIIIYPFLKKVYWKNQFSIIGFIIFAYFSFTYIMWIFIN